MRRDMAHFPLWILLFLMASVFPLTAAWGTTINRIELSYVALPHSIAAKVGKNVIETDADRTIIFDRESLLINSGVAISLDGGLFTNKLLRVHYNNKRHCKKFIGLIAPHKFCARAKRSNGFIHISTTDYEKIPALGGTSISHISFVIDRKGSRCSVNKISGYDGFDSKKVHNHFNIRRVTKASCTVSDLQR